MIIQFLLILGFLALARYFFRYQGTYQLSAWSKIFMIIFTLIAVYVIAFPNSSNRLAHFVGVNRGADLILYILTVSFVFMVLNAYVVRKRENQRIVALARKIALLEAQLDKDATAQPAHKRG